MPMARYPFRARCLVPGCRRTKGVAFDPEQWSWEWICADHWRLVSRTLKVRRTRFRRRGHRLIASALETADRPTNHTDSWFRDPLTEPPVTRWVRYAVVEKSIEHVRLQTALAWLWRKMRAQAIERAVGI
jgi:hypothetical protein